MRNLRVIARLDVKNEYVIKGIHLEGLRKVGNPNDLARKYYKDGIDEIVIMDAVASLYDRNGLYDIVQKACAEVFVPITVGGGIRSLEDFDLALKAGADKVAVNTQAIRTPEFVTEAARRYGSQCVVASIEAKRKGDSWEAYVSNGREATGVDVLEWIPKLEELGAGEIMLTSVDKEGTKKGFDLELAERAWPLAKIPIIASGGAGRREHLKELMEKIPVDAVALASMLHYKIDNIAEIKMYFEGLGIPVRR